VNAITEAEYRAIPALSGTGVAELLRSPADYHYKLSHPSEPSPAMALGTLTHALILGQEPSAVVSPYPDFRTKEAREWRDSQVLDVVTADVWAAAEAMAEAVHAHPVAAGLLGQMGEPEVVVTGEHRGAALKGRIDYLPASGPVIDIKTARDHTAPAMSGALGEYGIATQLAHYALLAGRDEDRPLVIAVRNTGRPAVAVYRIGEVTWAVALAATRRAWDLYAECIESGVWPDPYATGVHDLEMKSWALDELDPLSAEIEVK